MVERSFYIAPHISELSYTHGKLLDEIGFHGTEYFKANWDRYGRYPWTVLAHSAHVRGDATYERGVEVPRIKLTLASQIPGNVAKALAWVTGIPDPLTSHTGNNMWMRAICLSPALGSISTNSVQQRMEPLQKDEFRKDSLIQYGRGVGVTGKSPIYPGPSGLV